MALDTSIPLTWESEYELNDGGTMALAASGTATVSIDSSTQLVDLSAPRNEAYTCGWPLDNPGTLSSDDTLTPDQVMPNFWLEDECGDWVELWDFYGDYIVLDASQPDCGPCQSMASGGGDFVDDMQALGIPTRYITLLGASLSAVNEEPDDRTWAAWLDAYGDHGEPILKDRGYGYAVYGNYLGDALGYPVYAIIRPDMTVLEVNTGFGSWDDMERVITQDTEG